MKEVLKSGEAVAHTIIRSMHLEHYRCFENLDLDFDGRLTVLVGANGAGKTAVLDALGVFLRWAGHPLIRQGVCRMPDADVAVGNSAENLVYSLETQTPGHEPEQLVFSFKKYGHDPNALLCEAPTSFKPIRARLDVEKPVFVAYMAGRFISEKDSVLTNNNYSPSEHSAFVNNFTRTIDYAATVSWFNHADADEARAMRDRGLKTELPELKALREALSQALLEQYERPSMRGDPPELIIYKKGTKLAYKFSQLSDGYRAMLALVMDLARRMAQAQNDDGRPGESPLHHPAIVLIDEVELHLHPSWQQTVLPTLMGIFKKTQFIVTTHSPQVLTSIPDKQIRILSDGKAHSVTGQTWGAEASRLLKQVFGVEPRPKDLDIVKDLDTYTELVYAEKWEIPEAQELREKLIQHYGPDEPKLMELDLHIENSKWERGL